MSGGRFNYMDRSAALEIFDYCHDPERIPDVFEDREISELIYDVFELIHDYDWYASGDTGRDDYLASKAAFKRKWLAVEPAARTKRLIDQAAEHMRRELYEICGIDEGGAPT